MTRSIIYALNYLCYNWRIKHYCAYSISLEHKRIQFTIKMKIIIEHKIYNATSIEKQNDFVIFQPNNDYLIYFHPNKIWYLYFILIMNTLRNVPVLDDDEQYNHALCLKIQLLSKLIFWLQYIFFTPYIMNDEILKEINRRYNGYNIKISQHVNNRNIFDVNRNII